MAALLPLSCQSRRLYRRAPNISILTSYTQGNLPLYTWTTALPPLYTWTHLKLSKTPSDSDSDLACWGQTPRPCLQLWPLRRQRFCWSWCWTHRACWCRGWSYWRVTWWSACLHSHWENNWVRPGPGLCPLWWWGCWAKACGGGSARMSWWWTGGEGRRTCGWRVVTWLAHRREVCCSGCWQRKAPKSCRKWRE